MLCHRDARETALASAVIPEASSSASCSGVAGSCALVIIIIESFEVSFLSARAFVSGVLLSDHPVNLISYIFSNLMLSVVPVFIPVFKTEG